MYIIEYYKSKKIKPIVNEFEYSQESLYVKNIIDQTWNIKSITIDIKDLNLEQLVHNYKSNSLVGLYAKIHRLKNKYDTITILNNNSINRIFIYEIINSGMFIEKKEYNATSNYDNVKCLKLGVRFVK